MADQDQLLLEANEPVEVPLVPPWWAWTWTWAWWLWARDNLYFA